MRSIERHRFRREEIEISMCGRKASSNYGENYWHHDRDERSHINYECGIY
jgi:hypothetical protein